MKWVKWIGIFGCLVTAIYSLVGVSTTNLVVKQDYIDMINYLCIFIFAGTAAILFYNIYTVTKHGFAILVVLATLVVAISKALILAIKETHRIRQRTGSYTAIYGNCCNSFDNRYKHYSPKHSGKYLGGKK